MSGARIRPMTVVLALSAGFFLVSGVALSPVGRFLPAPVSVLTLGLIVIQFWRELSGRGQAAVAHKPGFLVPNGEVVEVFASLLALVMGIFLAGFSWGSSLFVGLFLRIRARSNWTTALFAAVLLWGFLAGLVEKGLGVTLYGGWLFGPPG